MKRTALLLICLVVLCALLLSPGLATQAQNKQSEGFAGSSTCLECHKKQSQTIVRNPHWKKAVKNAPVNDYGCESCHGAGAAHAEAGGGKGVGGIRAFGKGMTGAQKSAVCLGCHQLSKHLSFWNAGVHKRNDVACTNCHSMHTTDGRLVTASQLSTCGTCHKDIKVRANRRSHHPIPERKILCSSCHNPHGSLDLSMIKAQSVNQLCYTCRAEKRGPYVFSHPPVEEKCTNCHTTHGSVHEKLLVEKAPNLCQECHDEARHPGMRYSKETLFTGSSPSNRAFARSCLNCHSNIHGSNAPANPANGGNSGKTFNR